MKDPFAGAYRAASSGRCRIVYRHLRQGKAPRLVLLHGGSAHGAWWAAVAPLLATDFDVLVPDLSGHGDSGHRRSYVPAVWVSDVLAVLRQESGASDVTVVGHSMGGKLGIFLASRFPGLVRRLVIIDSSVREPGRVASPPRGRPRVPKRVYPDRETALGRFRLFPPGTVAAPELLRHVAEQGVTEVPGGWSWKFDPQASRAFTDAAIDAELRKVPGPLDFIYGEFSPLTGPTTADYIVRRSPGSVAVTRIAGAHHHVPLDTPQACAEAIGVAARR